MMIGDYALGISAASAQQLQGCLTSSLTRMSNKISHICTGSIFFPHMSQHQNNKIVYQLIPFLKAVSTAFVITVQNKNNYSTKAFVALLTSPTTT
jgi:hypothetical protein